jgi:hypothetical protein
MDAAGNQPVFVHCKRGADRTGALIAVYRVSHDGRTAERALEEAELYGMGFRQRSKKDFIRDYYRNHTAQTPAAQTDSMKGSTEKATPPSSSSRLVETMNDELKAIRAFQFIVHRFSFIFQRRRRAAKSATAAPAASSTRPHATRVMFGTSRTAVSVMTIAV